MSRKRDNSSSPDEYDTLLESTIGERLKQYRLELNLSQTELAESAGVARRTITSVETGKGCTLNTLLRLLKALNKIDLLTPLFEKPPLSPEKIHEINTIRESGPKRASKPRKTQTPKTFVWGDEK